MACLCHSDIVNGTRESEVGDFDPFHPILKQNIQRLNIAMDQALFVSGCQTGCDLHSDA